MRCSTWFAGYLLGEQAGNRKALEPLDPLVVAGKKYFQELNCAACHTVAGIPAAAPIASLKNADPARGCLSETTGKHPQFHLQDVQIQAITAGIKEEPQAISIYTNHVIIAGQERRLWRRPEVVRLCEIPVPAA